MRITPQFGALLPDELKAIPQWLLWRREVRHGKPTKVPYDSRSRQPGSVTDPAIYLAFERARDLVVADSFYEGIGFAVTASDPYCGVDLDHCLDDQGVLAGWARSIVERLDSYTEVTPSGEGLRVWLRGKLPPKHRRKGKLGPDGAGGIEFYDGERYFTVTGERFARSPEVISERQAVLDVIHAEFWPPRSERDEASRPAPMPITLSDREILDKMFRSKNGPAIRSLFDGDSTRHHSGSEADLALCSHLAFWCGGDIDAMDRLFRQSRLYDAKWEGRADYRMATIAKALEGATFYDPNYHRPPVRNRPEEAPAVIPLNAPAGGGGDGPVPPPPDEPAPAPAPPPNGPEGNEDPHRLARHFLEDRYGHVDGGRLRYWNEEWHAWTGQAWIILPDKEVAAEVTGAVKDEFDRIGAEAGRAPRPVTMAVVSNTMNAMRHLALLPLRECGSQPAWIGPFEPGEDLPDVRDILPAANALIDLPAVGRGRACTLHLSPRFFSPNTLGYSFNSRAAAPTQWLDFLGKLWPDDPESIEALQEWFGYLLTPDTSQQKILMVIGPKRSGKGTIGRVLRALVGPLNVAAPTLSGLATPFGLQPLIGKTLGLIGDARLSGRADGQVIVERLLSISGEDAQTIDRKHLSSWTGNLPTRFVLISNELPRLGDASGALPGRMIVLQLTRSFFGREDTTLTDRLMAERSAILLWAIEGWARLRERGRFIQPASALSLMEELDELASPVATFVAEMCDTASGATVAVKKLFDAWKQWCHDNGRDHPGDSAGFGRNLRAVLPQLKTEQVRNDGERVRTFKGLCLKNPTPAF